MKNARGKHGELPAYMKLYYKLRDDIAGGAYPSGSRLPSKRSLADISGVSAVTVEHAYALLADEGYIEARERSGYYVIFSREDALGGAAARADAMSSSAGVRVNEQPVPDGLSGSHSGQPLPPFPYSVMARAMRGVISEYGEAILERSPNTGTAELRGAVARYLARRRNIETSPDRIIIGSGSEYLYSLIIGLFGHDTVYAVEGPSYKKIEEVYRSSGVRYEMLPLGRDGIDSASLAACDAGVLHVSPYRSFPSGVTATASKRHEYLKWADKPGRFIIEDDFESEFSVSAKPEETLFAHSPRENVIYMNTFSMTVSPSFRTGYMVLPKHMTAAFELRLGFYSCTVPTFMQLVLARLIDGGDFERHIDRVRRAKRKTLPHKGSSVR
jgi:GntR family transcriptional regulator/MocR family aminotransferase